MRAPLCRGVTDEQSERRRSAAQRLPGSVDTERPLCAGPATEHSSRNGGRSIGRLLGWYAKVRGQARGIDQQHFGVLADDDRAVGGPERTLAERELDRAAAEHPSEP